MEGGTDARAELTVNTDVLGSICQYFDEGGPAAGLREVEGGGEIAGGLAVVIGEVECLSDRTELKVVRRVEEGRENVSVAGDWEEGEDPAAAIID